MNPAYRSLALGLLGVLILSVAAAAGVIAHARIEARSALLNQDRQAAAIAGILQRSHMRELALRAHVLAADPAFVDYVAQSLLPSPRLGGAVDSASINNLLDERRKGYDAAMVLDAHGDLVTRSGIPLRSTTDFRDDTLVQRVLRTRHAVTGFWSGQGLLTRVAVEPLLRGDTLKGILIAATRVKPDMLEELSSVTHTRAGIVVGNGSGVSVPLSKGLDPTVLGALNRKHPDVLDDRKGAHFVQLPVDRGVALAWVEPIASSDGHAALVILAPGAHDVNAILPPATHVFLAGIAILAAIGVGWVLLMHRRVSLPIEGMRRILQRAADGENGITLRTGGNASLRRLRDTINGVLERLS